MLVLKFDVKHSECLQWPTTQVQILTLGRAYIAHEAKLPPEERLKDLPLSLIQNALRLAETARDAESQGEADRVNAVATYRLTLSKAKEALRQARETLEARSATDILTLRGWGFDIVFSHDRPAIRLPNTDQDWFFLLAAYVQHEGSLPENGRVTQPPYAEMLALYQVIQESLEARQQGHARVEASTQVWSHEIQRLLELLQSAALTRILSHYNGQVVPELRAWGYEVLTPANETHPYSNRQPDGVLP